MCHSSFLLYLSVIHSPDLSAVFTSVSGNIWNAEMWNWFGVLEPSYSKSASHCTVQDYYWHLGLCCLVYGLSDCLQLSLYSSDAPLCPHQQLNPHNAPELFWRWMFLLFLSLLLLIEQVCVYVCVCAYVCVLVVVLWRKAQVTHSWDVLNLFSVCVLLEMKGTEKRKCHTLVVCVYMCVCMWGNQSN